MTHSSSARSKTLTREHRRAVEVTRAERKEPCHHMLTVRARDLTVAIVAACAALRDRALREGRVPVSDLALDLKGGTQLILTPTPTSVWTV